MAVEVALAAVLSAGAMASLRTVLGPSAHVVGEALARWTEHATRNVGRVAENAARKVPEGSEQNAPPIRVAMKVFEEASYAEDDVAVDYLGGILASSKSSAGRDDRGAVHTATIARMSTYQLRTHYVFYELIRQLSHGMAINFGMAAEASRAAVYIPFSVYGVAMDFSQDEMAQFDVIWPHCWGGS